MYNQYTETEVKERAAHKSYYRQMKNTFQKSVLNRLIRVCPQTQIINLA